ncbi:uncharacterized protein LOC119484734 [Sebastes umbrosus]|uniref:uncharacterized protein LOC119484734 n=1 Tax=Sebastes umbrosus TaxID=72105 RepID=UPI00189E7A5D|nr:uncharacterized protein LOC119484734 [Sebastes umbrosus]
MWNCQGTGRLHHNQHFQTGKILICVWRPCLTRSDQNPLSQFYQTLNLISYLVAGRCPRNPCLLILTFRSYGTGWQTLEHPPQNPWHLKVKVGPSLLTHLFLSSYLPLMLTMWNCQGTGRLHHNQYFQTGKILICVWRPCLTRRGQSPLSQFYQTLNLISYLVAGRCPRNPCLLILTFRSYGTGWQTLEHPPQNPWHLKVKVGPSLLTHLFLSSDLPISVTMWNCQGTGLLHHNQHFQTGKILIYVWRPCLTRPDQSPLSQFYQTLNLISYLVAGRCPRSPCLQILTFRSYGTGWQTLEHPPQNL